MRDRVLALAGLLQSVRLAQEMANNGQAESRPLAASIESLFRFDADSTEEVYGGVGGLESGLRRVVAQLDGSDRDGAQTRMAMNMLHLERRFVAAPEVVEQLRKRLLETRRDHQPWEPTHPAVLSHLGEVYADLISPLGPRVMVQGNPVYLSQPGVVAEVRA
ncbi:MAG: DUF489 family protein, partial [Arenimonas sp.]